MSRALRLSGTGGHIEIPDSETLNIGNAAPLTGNLTLSAPSGSKVTFSAPLDVPAGINFMIGGSALTTANWTAANLDTLLNGGNASALHTHSSINTEQLRVTGLNTSGMSQYRAGCISADDTITHTDCSVATGNFDTAAFAGVYDGAAGTLVTNGKVEVQFEGSLTIAAKDPALLSMSPTASNFGKFTNTSASAAVGSFATRVGTVLSTSSYGINQRCTIIIHASPPSKV